MHADKKSAAVRFSVLALLILVCVGGASAEALSFDFDSDLEGWNDESTGSAEVYWDDSDYTIPDGSAVIDTSPKSEDNDALMSQNLNLSEYVRFKFDYKVIEADEGLLVVEYSGCTGDRIFRKDLTSTTGWKSAEVNVSDATVTDLCFNSYGTNNDFVTSHGVVRIDNITFEYGNKEPKFNSSSITPDPPLIGESVSYGAEVYDSDGSVDYTNLTVQYGGSTVLSDEQRTGTVTPEWNDVFTPQTGNKWLNATLEVVDDEGAVSEKEINRYLSDDAPSVTLNDPGNQSYFKYDVPLSVSVDASDSEPEEDINCDIDRDGNLVEEVYFKEGTNSTYSGNISSDLGSHTLSVSCTDGSGNTGSQTESYTVKRFEISSTSASSPVYETTNQTFTADLKAGNMVSEVDTDLYWDGEKVDSETTSNSGVNSFAQILEQETPIVQNNKTNKDWKFKFNYIYDDINGNSQSKTVNSSTKQQEVLFSYFVEDSYFSPDKKYIETEDLQHNTVIHTETKKAEITGTTTYKRNQDTDTMVKVSSNTDNVTYRGVIDTGIADSFNKSTFDTSSEITVSFNGDTRTFSTGNDELEVYRIQLFDTANPGSLTTSETLKFDIDYEEEGYDTKAEFTMDLSVWKNVDEKIRRFQFQEPKAEEHTYHIYPSWAEYTIQTKPYPEQTKFDLIQYFNPDDYKVRRSYFFPVPQQIDNSTTTVPLKTINESEATQIDFEITQSGGQPAENTYCRVDRKFGGGDFETVFMIKTGSEGNSQSFAEINEIYYSFTCYKNGEVIEKFPAQIMQNPMILQIGETEVETQLDYSDKFDASCTHNEKQISCDYQSQSESLQKAVLEVDRVEPVTDIRECEKNSSTATGTLTCNGLNTSKNSYRYDIDGIFSDSITIQGDSGKTENQGSQYGAAGIILTMLIFMFVYAATSFNAPLGIGLGTLSILFSSVAGFLALTPAMRATLIGLAILAGVLSRR